MNCTIDANCTSGFCRAGSCKYMNIVNYPNNRGSRGDGYSNYEIVFYDNQQSAFMSETGRSKKFGFLLSFIVLFNFFIL